MNKPEFVDLMKMFWQKINFQPINYSILENSLAYQYSGTFVDIDEKIKICLDLGRLHKRKPIISKNEILAKAFEIFESAFTR